MIRSRLASLILVAVVWSAAIQIAWATVPSDIRVLQSQVDHVEFVYAPQGEGLMSFQVNGQQYMRPNWDYMDVEGRLGQPQIPVRHILIALPPGSIPRVQLGGETSHMRTEVRLPPIPIRSRDQSGMDTWQYVEDADAYRSNVAMPSQRVVVSQTFPYRGYTVVRVSIYPVIYYPASQRARILDRVQIRVDFVGAEPGTESRVRRTDPIMQELVINPGQASFWGAARTLDTSPPWPSGTMVKMAVRQEGIYRVTGSDLEQSNVSLTEVDPVRLRLFNNGGRELPRTVAAYRPDSLIENAILVVDNGTPGVFESDDYILFYGHGVTGWDKEDNYFEHYIHHYTEDNIYWLQIDPMAPVGKRMGQLGLSQSANITVTTTRARLFREDENYIYDRPDFPESGINWYMAYFSGSQSHTYTHSLSNTAQDEPFRLRCLFKSLGGSHLVAMYLNNQEIHTTPGIGAVIDVTGSGEYLQDGNNAIRFSHSNTGSMYLNWYEFEYTRSLTEMQGELPFESPQIDGIVRYVLDGFSSAQIFNITDPYDVSMTSGNEVVDSSQSSVWRRYFAVESGQYRAPLSMVIDQACGDEYQDLRTNLLQGIDYIAITADEFFDALAPYEQHRESFGDGMQTVRVCVSDVFDQFGWGLRDPTAIRDFLRYVSQNWSPFPPYLLLVGDGDYDYKNTGALGDWIPPFELGGRCTDDWFVYFTDYPNPSPEMAVGRWTVNSVDEVETVVQKVIQYESEPLYGPWRHRITLVADDEYGENGYSSYEKNHVEDTESIAENTIPRHFNLNKVYLIDYPVQWDAAAIGRRKPGATEDLIKAINNGTLIVNFIGHGNPHVWAHEQVFVADRDLPRIDNRSMLSLYVAATCSWGRFDDPLEQSFPEQLLVEPDRGSIASIAATRFTGSTSNETLARNFYSLMFQDPFDPKTLGMSLLLAKAMGTSETEKYHVLGDPTLAIGAPRFRTRITWTSTDTLQALSLYSLHGEVLNEANELWDDFSGVMELTVFDKRDSTTYLFNEGNGGSFTYILLGTPIFRGPSSITNGQFTSRFVVPLDIAFGGRNGRFSFYYHGFSATYGDSADGAGVRDSVCFAETAAEVTDSIPPVIDLMLENEFFREGDVVSPNPDVIAVVMDSSGINLTGEIGHSLRLILDNGTSWDVTGDFRYNLDSYTQGETRTTIGPIDPGDHMLCMEAWDSFNNLAWTEVTFTVAAAGEEGFEIKELLPYPNPFDRQTNLTFFITRDSWVTLKIYTVAGRLIYSQEGIEAPYGYNWELTWDGRDAEGDKVANGVYLYKLAATSTSGEHCEEIGRVVVMR